ncbi:MULTISPECIES: DNA mismatch endonuclease Vsr [Tatumella]|uniref:Very short patch repair endonuclease n=1 Tax=Tatumella punctata TaxID=399969 RepID=A0ABW1VI49_9GAMM|nr:MULTISPECIES: DNA mismatch endonuclease Vsr [unclassified Tatumella]MBS0855097.1 DNA mismatch endonuclease Vsr [Tatumella sp. JGM16]MBS0876127.1 DNA mismatch endonuclease Vsr [Tatumella sp. JGM82]MBS0889175.1 DNA mismatch endonuclease Vsr [Tatumella sp. JGM94]MBS0892714.1 DNA mismatch endonuclease Vsr [Tatumella sp. JGM130]MBS0901057.1 DNA mismatch endonuclease Vsr [Tatumella sp. JGM100]
MADVHDEPTRSKNMRAIRDRDTSLEKRILWLLQSLNIPASQQVRELPGRPDFVLQDSSKIIFTHGCFWHRHSCHLYKPPATRRTFWQQKIDRNAERDEQILEKLQAAGWNVLIIWECALKGKYRLTEKQLTERVEEWVCTAQDSAEISQSGLRLLSK